MKKLFIFGGSGSLGNQLTEFYLDKYEIVIASRDEAKLWAIRNKFRNPSNLKTIVCDVRESQRVSEVLLQEKPEVIIIAHALKQVDICEQFPQESIKTNVLGTANIINALTTLNLSNIYIPEVVCFVSTDKACSPINTYGMCKSISEKIVLNASDTFKNSKFFIVRYGNVLNSTGSILPLLLKQALDSQKEKFSLTHEAMTRFMMSLSEAVALINTAMINGQNGDLWVPKLPSMKIIDLIEYFSKKFLKSYEVIGIRPGEKIHESMLTLEEASRVEFREEYFVCHKDNQILNNLTKEYSSADYVLSSEELCKFMDLYLKGI